jgi:hypothetical protein
MDSLYRTVEGGGKYVDLEPLNSDEKDLTNAIKVRVSGTRSAIQGRAF